MLYFICSIKPYSKRNVVNKFVEAHADNIHAEISYVDRIIFKGYSSLSWADNMESYLSYNNILIKDFKKYAQSLSYIINGSFG